VVARIFILAAGGIENARLLLSSNRFQAGGIGNRHDVVGRYFMDHPRWRGGQMSFSDIRTNSGLYDLYGTYTGKIAVEGTKVAGFFGISPETQRAERIANTRCYVKSRFLGDSPQAAVAAQILFRGLYGRGPLRGRSRADLFKLARYLPQVAAIAIGMKYHSKRLHRGFVLETVFEPTPLPESRVTLRPDKDALGMQRVQVDWRLGELEKYTLRRTQQILAEEIKQESAGSVKINIPPEGDAWPNTLSGCWHHMGTTRMHSDPRRGVVDANCCVHDMKNLFIAGSSVFPTAGSDMPTITIVALALRLAEHIKHIRTAGET
jgi:choline dehydrogenase-like flavoprotein